MVAYIALFGLARSSSAMTQLAASSSPWIASDKLDYAPGSTVHLTGGNWAPGEEVRIVTNDTLGNTWSQTDTVTADGSGAIVDDVVLPNYFVSDYTVNATAQSGTATTTFTDAVNYQFLGKDGLAHTTAAAEESLGSVTSGSNVGATCPTGLTAKGSGLGGGQSSSYAISYVSGYGDNSTLSTPISRTQISPASGTFNGNGSTCASLAISTSGLAAGTYHGELQMRNTGGATATTALYFFKFTVAPTQQPTSISAVSGAGTYGGTGSLTATLMSGSAPVSGKAISFTLNGTSVGSATTDAAGVATLGGVSLGSIDAGTQSGAVAASFSGDSGFSASSGGGSLTVAQAVSTTTVSCPATSLGYDGSAKTPCSASVAGVGGLNQTLAVSYSNNTEAGTATAGASYAGDPNHTGSSDSKTFTIGKAPSTTTVSCPASVTYDGSAKAPCSATASGLGGLNQPVSVSYSGNTDAGTATASATFAGDANHDGSSDSKTFSIAKADQTITFDGAPFSAAYGQTFQVQPTASSGLSVSLSGTAGVCNVTPNALQVGVFDVQMLAGTGSCVLNASQPGNGNYNAATDVSRNVAAAKANQSITFDALAGKMFGDADFAVSAFSSSGLGVDFAAAGDCSISGSTVHISGAGSCAITASQSGNGNYNAATDVARSFTIAKAPSSVSVRCDAGPFTYTGSAMTPCSAKVTGIGGLDQPLPVTYSDNVNAGVATAFASYAGDANHLGDTGSATFTIDKAPSNTTVTCPTSRTYTGSAIEPCSAAATGAGALDTPLTVSYAANVETGTATASASFAGDDNHTGSAASATFTIEKAPSTVTVTCPASRTYTGDPLEPCTANATGAGALDVALTVTYTGNLNAGTANASATYAGDANHTGNSASSTFAIERAPSDVSVSCTAGPFVYTGSAHTPCSARVTGAGGLDLTLTVAYANNVDAGTATASAGYDGDANHTGDSASQTFTIQKAASAVGVSCPDSRTYSGSAIEPCTARATGAGGLDTAVSVSYSDNVNAGTAAASATYAGDSNHLGSSGSATFTIAKAVSTVTVTCATGPFTYNGAPQTPCSAKATGAGGLDTPLTVSYSDNVDAGTATASAAYAGDANHLGDSSSQTFTIGKATPTVSVTWSGWTYDGAAHPATGSVTGVGGASLGSPTFTYYSGGSASGTPLAGAPSGVGPFTVVASFAGNANYLPASKTKTVSVLYRWDGFLQPINDTAHQGLFESSFKLGSTIPAKFQLKKADGGIVQAGVLPVFSRSTTPVACDTQIAPEGLDTDSAFSGSTFRWDATAQQYIYNWSTKGLRAGEYRIYAALDDGSRQYVDICLQ